MLSFFSLTNTDTDTIPEKNKKEDIGCTYGGISAKLGYEKCRSRYPDIAETIMRILFGCFVVMALLSVGSLAYVIVHQYSEIYMPFLPDKDDTSEKETAVPNVTVRTLLAVAPRKEAVTDSAVFHENLSGNKIPAEHEKRIVTDKSEHYRYRENLANPCANMSRPFGNACKPQMILVYQPQMVVARKDNIQSASDFVSVTDEYAERYHIPKGVMVQTNRYSDIGILEGDIVVEIGTNEITDMNDIDISDGNVIRVFRRNRYIDVDTAVLSE